MAEREAQNYLQSGKLIYVTNAKFDENDDVSALLTAVKAS